MNFLLDINKTCSHDDDCEDERFCDLNINRKFMRSVFGRRLSFIKGECKKGIKSFRYIRRLHIIPTFNFIF